MLSDTARVILDNACAAIQDLIVLSTPGNPLPDKHRGKISSRAKWLRNALGHMLHAHPDLAPELASYALEPPPTDDELDARAEQLERERLTRS